jgi:hypothetical protein
MEERMEKLDKDQSVLYAAIGNVGNVIEKAFLPNQQQPSKLDVLLKNFEEADAAIKKFVAESDPEKNAVVLYSFEYKLKKAKRALKNYWNERGEHSEDDSDESSQKK